MWEAPIERQVPLHCCLMHLGAPGLHKQLHIYGCFAVSCPLTIPENVLGYLDCMNPKELTRDVMA